MCGIVGVLAERPLREEGRESLAEATRSLARRGPDGEGLYVEGNLGLGHRRLAILDPDQGRQPWVDPASGVALTYNGEIYNFRSLRGRLEGKGHRFQTDCDTELLVRAYLEWGTDCLQVFSGMFAFALYDPRRGGIWLVRDRLGIKPLYYYPGKDGLIFASSLKALMTFPEVPRRLDGEAAWHYFRTIRTTLRNKTLLSGVYSLEPGTHFWWAPGEGIPRAEPYWELPACSPEEKLAVSFEDAVETTRERLEAAIREQLVSDVPVGGFLSGGLDSSILAALVSNGRTASFGTFSTGYRRHGYNEWIYAREASTSLGVAHEEVALEEADYFDQWNWLIEEKGQPLSTPNEIPIFKLAEAFGRQFTVALTGEGADEVFGGYTGPTYSALDFDRSRGRHGSMDGGALSRWYGCSGFATRMDHYFRVNSWLPEERLREILNASWIPAVEGDPVRAYYQSFFDRYSRCSTFDAYLRIQLRTNLEGLLSRLDTSTMAAGVEGRVPFTDHRLVEWVFSLPDDFKMAVRPGLDWKALRERTSFELVGEGLVLSKRLLREGYREIVPPSVLERQKMSFPVPFLEWFADEADHPMQQVIRENRGSCGLLSENLPTEMTERDPMLGWPLANLCLWMRRFSIASPG